MSASNATNHRLRPSQKCALITFGIVAATLICATIIATVLRQSRSTSTADRQSVGSLDLDFLRLENNQQNLIYSPLSIKNGLALLDAGAAGNTKAQLDAILNNASLPTYQNTDETSSLANAVFIREDFQDSVYESYIDSVTTNYNAEVIFDDFQNSSTIDAWVKQKTFNLIPSLNLSVKNETKMVLANVLAIQMGWASPFETVDRLPFYPSTDDTKIVVDTISDTTHSSSVSYHLSDDFTLLAMDLDADNLEFVAIMPTKEQLNTFIQRFSSIDEVDQLISERTSADQTTSGVTVRIPKFSFSYQLQFKDDLKALGLTDAFNDSAADFSNLASVPLFLSDATHEANIEFTESGIKASAVTGFSMNVGSAARTAADPVKVTIDHPFLFLVRNKSDGEIWFIGTVYDPSK